MELKLKDSIEFVKTDGGHVAPCNVAGMHSYDEILLLRQEPIGVDAMTETLSLACYRFNAALNSALISYYAKILERECGKTEYLAAFEDFMRTKVFFADFLPWILNHVKEQRENGPDLINLSLQEKNP
jgi:hypothetical protein